MFGQGLGVTWTSDQQVFAIAGVFSAGGPSGTSVSVITGGSLRMRRIPPMMRARARRGIKR